jgi:hypothetical protein
MFEILIVEQYLEADIATVSLLFDSAPLVLIEIEIEIQFLFCRWRYDKSAKIGVKISKTYVPLASYL